jgi:hypothetical protein
MGITSIKCHFLLQVAVKLKKEFNFTSQISKILATKKMEYSNFPFNQMCEVLLNKNVGWCEFEFPYNVAFFIGFYNCICSGIKEEKQQIVRFDIGVLYKYTYFSRNNVVFIQF